MIDTFYNFLLFSFFCFLFFIIVFILIGILWNIVWKLIFLNEPIVREIIGIDDKKITIKKNYN